MEQLADRPRAGIATRFDLERLGGTRRAFALGTSLALAAAVAGSGAVDARTTPTGGASGWVRHVTNPWYPLTPGTTYVYRGTKDGKGATDIVQVTHKTKLINGVRTTVILDTLVLDGRIRERTVDWFAQDGHGTVWYFGERTHEYDAKGHAVTSAGSWQDGTGGDHRGIFMPAHPHVGDEYQQEHSPGNAEDHFRITSLSANVTVPYGSWTNAMRTKEWTPLEPDVRDAKFYVKGLGMVKEATIRGGNEEIHLVQVLHR